MKDVKQEQIDECRDNTGGSLRELATTWHKEAQKTGVKETYDLAQYLYKEYLKQFPKEKDIYPMTFYYGELLFKLEQVLRRRAHLHRRGQARHAPTRPSTATSRPTPRSSRGRTASTSTTRASTQAAEAGKLRGDKSSKEDDPKKKKSERRRRRSARPRWPTYKPKDIPETWKTMLDAFDTYVQYVPNAPELVTIKYRRARVYYEYNHFAEAAPLFEDIVKNHTKDDLAIYSANLYFDCAERARTSTMTWRRHAPRTAPIPTSPRTTTSASSAPSSRTASGARRSRAGRTTASTASPPTST